MVVARIVLEAVRLALVAGPAEARKVMVVARIASVAIRLALVAAVHIVVDWDRWDYYSCV
jgi:hypothetical protein